MQDKQRFKAIPEHASMGIIETNENADIIHLNSFACTLFAYDKKALLGKKIGLLIPTRFHPKHISHRNTYVPQPKSRPVDAGMDLYAVKVVQCNSELQQGTRFIITFNKSKDLPHEEDTPH